MPKKGQVRCNNPIGFKKGNQKGYCRNYPAVKFEGSPPNRRAYCQKCLDEIEAKKNSNK